MDNKEKYIENDILDILKQKEIKIGSYVDFVTKNNEFHFKCRIDNITKKDVYFFVLDGKEILGKPISFPINDILTISEIDQKRRLLSKQYKEFSIDNDENIDETDETYDVLSPIETLELPSWFYNEYSKNRNNFISTLLNHNNQLEKENDNIPLKSFKLKSNNPILKELYTMKKKPLNSVRNILIKDFHNNQLEKENDNMNNKIIELLKETRKEIKKEMFNYSKESDGFRYYNNLADSFKIFINSYYIAEPMLSGKLNDFYNKVNLAGIDLDGDIVNISLKDGSYFNRVVCKDQDEKYLHILSSYSENPLKILKEDITVISSSHALINPPEYKKPYDNSKIDKFRNFKSGDIVDIITKERAISAVQILVINDDIINIQYLSARGTQYLNIKKSDVLNIEFTYNIIKRNNIKEGDIVDIETDHNIFTEYIIHEIKDNVLLIYDSKYFAIEYTSVNMNEIKTITKIDKETIIKRRIKDIKIGDDVHIELNDKVEYVGTISNITEEQIQMYDTEYTRCDDTIYTVLINDIEYIAKL